MLRIKFYLKDVKLVKKRYKTYKDIKKILTDYEAFYFYLKMKLLFLLLKRRG